MLRHGGIAIQFEGQKFPTVTPLPVETETGETLSSGTWKQLEEWVAAGGVIQLAPPPDHAEYDAAINAYIEAAAKAKGYESGAALASYAGSGIKQWASDAKAYVKWRDAVWTEAYAILDTGERPELPDLIGRLPG